MLRLKEKEKAINLRKKGFSYSEILREVAVAKSTLSLWLRSVGLSKKQKQRLTEKKLAAMKRGAEACRRKRIKRMGRIITKAKKEINRINKRDLWLLGIALYWAEGTKEKPYNIGQGVALTNSDPLMVKVFLKWLKDILNIKESDIKFEIYIHENHRVNINNIIKYWSEITNSDIKRFQYVYFKKHKIRTNRRNTGADYHGLLRVSVRKSTDLNRKISGWVSGITINCGVV